MRGVVYRTGKRHCLGVNSRYDESVDRRIREKQWHHWLRDADRFDEALKVVAYVTEKHHR